MLQLCSIVPAPFFNYQGVVLGTQPPPPLRISDSKQRESIVLQLYSIVLQFFQLYRTLFSITRGWFSELSPPPHFEFRIRNNRNQPCSNCAQLCCNFFQLYLPLFSITRGGGWFSEIRPPIANFGFETTGIKCANKINKIPLTTKPHLINSEPTKDACFILYPVFSIFFNILFS